MINPVVLSEQSTETLKGWVKQITQEIADREPTQSTMAWIDGEVSE